MHTRLSPGIDHLSSRLLRPYRAFIENGEAPKLTRLFGEESSSIILSVDEYPIRRSRKQNGFLITMDRKASEYKGSPATRIA